MKIFLKSILGNAYRPIITRLKIILWFFPALCSVIFLKRPAKKRILIVYDLSTQPFSIGDILTVQEASLVLKERYSVEFIDIAILCDQQDPKLNDNAFKIINSKNYFYHLSAILPVAQVNPNLGSIFGFNSYSELQEYVLLNIERIYIWPSKWKASVTREYLYYSIFEDILYPFYEEYGYLPYLQSREMLRKWAKVFYHTNSNGLVPISVNIRNNPHFQTERNLNIDVWLEFFGYCKDLYPVKFFIICAASEVDNRLRVLDNVVVVKDYFTNIEQDLALISESIIHMGAPSGPATMRFFSDKPYLIFRSEFHLQHFSDSKIIKYEDQFVQKFFFSKENQFFISQHESKELLIKYFSKIWMSLDVEGMNFSNEIDSTDLNLDSWLR